MRAAAEAGAIVAPPVPVSCPSTMEIAEVAMRHQRRIDLIEAPSNLGLRPPAVGKEPGTRLAPEALRAAGLHQLLAARSELRVAPPRYDPDDARTTNIRNMQNISVYSRMLATEIGASLQAAGFPLVIGGDCSILLGAGVALKRLGNYGLIFIDGHTDFFLPEQSASGGAAGMDLALATGWGPQFLTNIDGLRPYFRPLDVLLMGNRDFDERPSGAIPNPEASGMDYWDLPRLRQRGIPIAVSECLRALTRRAIDGFWIHLDVDALDDAIMPAVDSRQPGGLSWQELECIVEGALATGHAVGMEVTIFDPDLDSTGSVAVELARNIACWFGS
jgi:arginase